MTATKSRRLAREVARKLLGQAGQRTITRQELEAVVQETLLSPKHAKQPATA